METHGTESAGYSVDVAGPAALVTVRAWGFWDVELALGFARNVLRACATAPAGAQLSFDAAGLKPMRDEGQAALARVLDSLSPSPISQVVITTSSQLIKLQLMRIARQSKFNEVTFV
jgi:hypothetical protein